MTSLRPNRKLHPVSVGLALAVIFASAFANAQDITPYEKINAATAASPVTALPVRGGVTLLDGAGGNIAVLAGNDGLLLVDAGIAVSRDKMEAALGRIRPGPITYLVNTHWHWDHTDGNSWAHEDGAIIVAHPNTARHLGETIRVVEWGHTFEPLAAGFRPTRLISEVRTIEFAGETVDIRPYMASHTDGDLSVYFRKADVLVTGDTWWNGMYPFIDYVAGGSIDGMIAAAEANLAMITAKTKVIPGHGPIGGAPEMKEFRDMLVAVRARVAALKAKGMTLEQIVAAAPTAPFDAKWGGGIITPSLFTELVYRGVRN